MIDSVVKNVVDLLAKRLTGQTIGTSMLFWLIGVAVYLLTRPPAATTCAPGYVVWWCDLRSHGPFGIGVLAAMALAAVIATTTLVSALSPQVMDLALATHWPGRRGLRSLGAWLTKRQSARRSRLWKARDEAAKLPDTTTAAAAEGVVWNRIRRYPREQAEGDLIGPTTAGNALRAVMQRVRSWSGLDLSVCWRLLVAVVPDEVRAALGNAATIVFGRAQLLVFSGLTVVWWPLLGWRWPLLLAVVVTVVSTAAALRGLRVALIEYAGEVEVCVLIHRMALYDALHQERPVDSSAEAACGAALMDYLQRVNSGPVPFVKPTP